MPKKKREKRYFTTEAKLHLVLINHKETTRRHFMILVQERETVIESRGMCI